MSNTKITSPLVSVQWLAEHLDSENLVILDASMKPVTLSATDSLEEDTTCIQGAMRFDFDNDIRDKNTDLPHMMPSPEFFTEEMQKLGINKTSAIVAYDRVGVYSSPRAWWMFRAMGHGQVAVLDGGLPAWKKAGFACDTQPKTSAEHRGNFIAKPQDGLFCDSADMLAALSDPGFAVLDARSNGRFKGTEPEPRAGLRPGHMPNSINLPYADVVVDGFISPRTKLDAIFSNLVKQEQKLIFSCGSGVTACITALAAELAGYSNIAVYDGSWSEWGLPSSGLPVETG
ncbi:MAG TPA: sulfurtransferase [Anaerolineales bacterium]|nr:sulfurtransferase [Anaerolineales bacterium]